MTYVMPEMTDHGTKGDKMSAGGVSSSFYQTLKGRGVSVPVFRRTLLPMMQAAFLLSACFLFAVPAAADIYRYVDERGTTIFTDTPRHSGYEIHLREKVSYRTLSGTAGYYPYRDIVVRACAIYEVDEALVRAVIEVESDYNRYAFSQAGARGLMQLMPETISHLGVRNPWDPEQNVQAGTRYLRNLLVKFPGSVEMALAAYNAGLTNVLRYGAIPPFPQTVDYVKKVMNRYRELSGFRR
jgi:hypothetical protein